MFEVLAEFLPRNVRPSVGITWRRGRIGRLRCQKIFCADGKRFKHIQLFGFSLVAKILADTFVVKRPKPLFVRGFFQNTYDLGDFSHLILKHLLFYKLPRMFIWSVIHFTSHVPLIYLT